MDNPLPQMNDFDKKNRERRSQRAYENVKEVDDIQKATTIKSPVPSERDAEITQKTQ